MLKDIHPLFAIGFLGVVATLIFHFGILQVESNWELTAWSPLYVVWMLFLFIGQALTMRHNKLL